MFTFPGAPCIYYGDEIGMDGEHDPFCRKPFSWDENLWDKNLLNYVKEIVALRKKNPALRRGDHKRLWSANGVYAFSRSYEGKTFFMALNASGSPQQIHVTHEAGKLPKPFFGEAVRNIFRWTIKFYGPGKKRGCVGINTMTVTFITGARSFFKDGGFWQLITLD